MDSCRSVQYCTSGLLNNHSSLHGWQSITQTWFSESGTSSQSTNFRMTSSRTFRSCWSLCSPIHSLNSDGLGWVILCHPFTLRCAIISQSFILKHSFFEFFYLCSRQSLSLDRRPIAEITFMMLLAFMLLFILLMLQQWTERVSLTLSR